MGSTTWSLLMLLLVIALIPLVLWTLKRLQTFRPPGSTRRLEVTAQLALGARERLVMVRVDERMLVLGVTPQQITLLAAAEAEGDAAPLLHAQPQPATGAIFGKLLRSMSVAPGGRLP